MGEVEFIEPRVVPRPQHPISRSLIDRNALKVLYRLHEAGFRALLVGGSVRDLMLGRQPKDFDVATDARPNEIRRLFRNARIIGRRFRLAPIGSRPRSASACSPTSGRAPSGRRASHPSC